VRLLAQIHDELIIECPAEAAAAVARQTKAIMEGVRRLAVPLVATVQSGVAWGSLETLNI
jgi:DNA polymerase-1